MLWKKKQGESPSRSQVSKLPGPGDIPELVKRYLIAERKMDPDLARILKAVVRASSTEKGVFNIRIFDQAEAAVKKIAVENYTSLDEHPILIIYEGWFDEGSKRVKLEEKKKATYDVPLFTESEIREKIEALREPGSRVFFYQATGAASGGPLGRGAAVVELNPNYPGARQKKYIIYTADVDGMEPVGKGQKLWDSNEPEKIAGWISQAHHRRQYWGYQPICGDRRKKPELFPILEVRRSRMFWKKKVEKPSQAKVEKLPGPKGIPELVGSWKIWRRKTCQGAETNLDPRLGQNQAAYP